MGWIGGTEAATAADVLNRLPPLSKRAGSLASMLLPRVDCSSRQAAARTSIRAAELGVGVRCEGSCCF